jgi:hypothetical protein
MCWALVVVVSCFAAAPRLQAAQDQTDAIENLTQGAWHFKKTPNHQFTFATDGSFKHYNEVPGGTFKIDPQGGGNWKFGDDTIVMVFADGSQYVITLPINPRITHVVDDKGNSRNFVRSDFDPATGSLPDAQTTSTQDATTEAPAPTPAGTPIPADVQAQASAIIQLHHDSLVFVTGTAGEGSGFIATINGSNFLVTNVHVTAEIRDAAFKTLEGVPVQGGLASMAVGEDIFCMEMPPGGHPFEIMQSVDQNAAIGDDVVILGNAEGEGVVNTIIGKIVGIGPNLVEVDAPFVPGNSGSPIIHLKTGKVIGVATYLLTTNYDLATNQKLQKPVVRRFGYRLDSVKGWQAVNWRAFYAQAELMEQTETLTDDLGDFLQDLADNNGMVTLGRHNNPVIKDRIDDWIAEKKADLSDGDAANANANFLSFLKTACQADVTAARYKISYDYFARELSDQKLARDEMSKDFDQLIQAQGQ